MKQPHWKRKFSSEYECEAQERKTRKTKVETHTIANMTTEAKITFNFYGY